MVLGDESFYTVTGEEVNRTILLQTMIDFFNDKYPDTEITDFNEGSEIRNILESIAVDIYHLERNDMETTRIAFLTTAYGSWLDLIGESKGYPRIIGLSSSGYVTFSIPDAINEEIVIPFNTIVVSEVTGLQFNTTMEAVISIGETSVDVPVQCVIHGSKGNAAVNTVTLFADVKPYNALSVTNPEEFIGGVDDELDEEYRSRLLDNNVNGDFGSKPYYMRLGADVEGVHDVFIAPPPSSAYTNTIIVNGDIKPVSDDLLALVLSVYTNENNIILDHKFTVSKVQYNTVNLTINVNVTDTISDSVFTNTLSALFDGGNIEGTNYNGLNINEPLTDYTLKSALESITGVIKVTNITSGGTTVTTITPDTNKVLKLGTVTINQTMVE